MVSTSDDDAANSCQGHLAEAGGSVSEALNTEEGMSLSREDPSYLNFFRFL